MLSIIHLGFRKMTVHRYVLLAAAGLFLLAASPALAQRKDGLAHYVNGEKLRQEKKFLEAIDDYNKAIAENPANENFYFQRGKCQIMIRQEESAIASLEKVVALKPSFVEAHASLAWLYQRKENYAKAIKYFDLAYQHDSRPEARFGYKNQIVRLLFKQNNIEQAGKHIKEALILKPYDANMLYCSARYHNIKQDYDRAREDAMNGISILKDESPVQSTRLYYELCHAYYYLKQYERLADVLPKASYGPYRDMAFRFSPEYKFVLARAYFMVYDFERARKLLSEALVMDQSNSKVYDLQIKIADASSDKSKLVAHLQEVVLKDADATRRRQARIELSSLYLLQGRYPDAILSADAVLKEEPANYIVGYYKAMALAKQGKYDLAVRQFQELLSNRALDVTSKAKFNFALGLTLMKKQVPTAAIDPFKNAKLDYSFRHAAEEWLAGQEYSLAYMPEEGR